MSIISSFYIGASGLNSNSIEMSVVGDNIANANTIGFKASRTAFADVVAETLIGSTSQLGGGSRVASIQKLIQQGAITTTGIATDLAIQGGGFFMVNGKDGERMFTRAGQMTLDQSGFLVNLDGLRVQGFGADALGNISAGLGDLNLTGATAPPKGTESITIKGNLTADPNEPDLTFDVANISETSNFSTTIQIFDSLGNPHSVDVHFSKTGAGDWQWNAVMDGSEFDGGIAGTPTVVGTGALTFDENGNLVTDPPIGTLDGMQDFAGGATVPATPIEIDFSAMVQQSTTPSSVNFIGQDGFGAGQLAGVTIDEAGEIIGTFTNGQKRALGQIAVADFAADDQLDRVGNNLFRATGTSGEPNIGVPGTGGRGSIVAGALEQSNVDLSNEFIRMIVAQRSFQANSKTLQTADQILAELIQIKR